MESISLLSRSRSGRSYSHKRFASAFKDDIAWTPVVVVYADIRQAGCYSELVTCGVAVGEHGMGGRTGRWEGRKEGWT